MKRLLIIVFVLPLWCAAQTADSYVQSGNAKVKEKDYQGAITDFTKAIQLGDTKASTYFYRANAYGNLKEFKQAIDDFTKTIQIEPNYTNAYFYRADAENSI